MKKHGGKREGAGRPIASATLEAQKQRELLVGWLEPELAEIFSALALKAKSGDVAAEKELFDRAWGKATQPLEVGGPNGEPLETNLSKSDRKAITELRDLLK